MNVGGWYKELVFLVFIRCSWTNCGCRYRRRSTEQYQASVVFSAKHKRDWNKHNEHQGTLRDHWMSTPWKVMTLYRLTFTLSRTNHFMHKWNFDLIENWVVLVRHKISHDDCPTSMNSPYSDAHALDFLKFLPQYWIKWENFCWIPIFE